jgi:hypothetical protein
MNLKERTMRFLIYVTPCRPCQQRYRYTDKTGNTGKCDICRRESIPTAFLALVIAVGIITWLALPCFNNIAGKSITMGFLLSPAILLLLITLPLWVGLGNQVEASAVCWWGFSLLRYGGG